MDQLTHIPTAVEHMLFVGSSLSVGARAAPRIVTTSNPYGNAAFAGKPRRDEAVQADPLIECTTHTTGE